MKPTLLCAFVVALFACGGGTRSVSGTLLSQHPADTSVLALSGRTRVEAAVGVSGRFTLQLPPGDYRLRFVSRSGGRQVLLGTLSGPTRRAPVRVHVGGRAVELGTVGRADQRLAPSATAADPCRENGEGVDLGSGGGNLGPDVAEADVANGDAGGDPHDGEVCNGEDGHGVRIKTLSNRADLVSGGDAYLEILLPRGASAEDLKVDVGGRDVSDDFAVRESGRVLGVVTGLSLGDNVVTARLADGSGARLTINNHPIGGPVFSGPQIQPWVCATREAQPESGTTPATNSSGLSTEAFDAQCNIATEYTLYYKTTAADCSNDLPDPIPPKPPPENPCFKPYAPGADEPDDLAWTTTDAGVTMPYIVRVERGTLNRGIYDIAVLFDPEKSWAPWAPQEGWNGKVVYTFGASTGQPRRQFRSEQSWVNDEALSRGFMVALNSMTDSLYNSNRVAMAETLMMMKEHIGDTYGEIRFTIGNGCSGGSINQNTAASIFPGLLDGIQPTCTYPDSETTAIEVSDCVQLVNFYNSAPWLSLQSGLTQEQINAKKAAINGHVDQSGCHAWNNLFGNGARPGNFVATVVVNNNTGATGPSPAGRVNNCQLPAALVYDPATNPGGFRCGDHDHAVSIWGTAPGVVPGTSRGRGTRDNVGVQYGLKALNAGAITAEDFVTLNEGIGGTDGDGNASSRRTQADLEALGIAYTSGIVTGNQLGKVAIIDLRGYDDSNIPPPRGIIGIHHIWRSFSLRARLDHANGNHDNHVMWRYGTGLTAPAASGLTLQSFLTMDRWLTRIASDTSDAPIAQKIVENKPATAFDFCFLSDDTTFSTKITDQAICDADRFLRPSASPRQVAGGPVTEDVLKCQLKALDTSDYKIAFTAGQLSRLQAVFPTGVCDWSKPGVNQQPAISPLTFEEGPGGAPLPPAPASSPL